MKSKQSSWLIGLILLLVILIYATWHLHKHEAAAIDNSLILTNQENSPVVSSMPASANNPTQQIGKPQLSSGFSQAGTGLISSAVSAWSQQIHRPIEFYGKVVDEKNQPVAEANIQLVWTQFSPLPEGSFNTNVVSDKNGLFGISSITGASLGVYVSKAGYYNVDGTDNSHFIYSALPGSQPFNPDPNHPVVYHLRRKGAGVDLITSKNGMKKYLAVALPLDGSPVGVDLINHKIGVNGQVIVSQIKPSADLWKQASKWSFDMQIPGGGFVHENDAFPFLAPDSGYQPEISFNFQTGQTNWTTDIEQDFYFKFGNPPQYGRLHLDTSIDMSGARLTYVINPDGSRNLEPK